VRIDSREPTTRTLEKIGPTLIAAIHELAALLFGAKKGVRRNGIKLTP